MYKLTNLAFAMLMMLLVSACGNDDETISNSDLEDTWTVLSVEIDIETSTVAAGQTVTSDIDASGGNLAYDLTLDGGEFTTTGDYEMTVSAAVDGMIVSSSTDSYNDVNGSGTYVADASTITINGSFFDFEYNGMSFNTANGEQTANYTINSDDQLVISQNDVSTSDANGVMVTSAIISTSVWERK